MCVDRYSRNGVLSWQVHARWEVAVVDFEKTARERRSDGESLLRQILGLLEERGSA
jgi:hypothetical protein